MVHSTRELIAVSRLRTVHNTKPPRVNYALTARGLSLLDIVQSLARWAEDNSGGILDSRTTFDTEQA